MGPPLGLAIRPKITLKLRQGPSSTADEEKKTKMTTPLALVMRPKSTLGRRQRCASPANISASTSDDDTDDNDDEAPEPPKAKREAGRRATKRPRTWNMAHIETPSPPSKTARLSNNTALPSAALIGFTDAPHPQFTHHGPLTSQSATALEVKLIVQRYVHSEDGLTGLGKMNLENLLTIDGYPCTEAVHALARVYVDMVEEGTGEGERLEWIRGAFWRYSYFPAELVGSVGESFVGGEDKGWEIDGQFEDGDIA